MKNTVDAIHHAFFKRMPLELALDFVFVQCVEAGGYNSMALTDEQAQQIVEDYGYELEILETQFGIDNDQPQCKFKFKRRIV